MKRRAFIFVLLGGIQAVRAEGGRGQPTGKTVGCENVAALRAIEGKSKDIAVVAGYLARGDGGGGRFIWNPIMTISDNGGTIVAGPSKVGRWVREPGPVRPEWFGARGDGKTNDTDALGAMLGVAKNVTFSHGKTYAITSIACTSEIVIQGNGATLLQLPLAPGSRLPMIHILESNVRISDVQFDGQRSLQPKDGFSDSFDTGRIGTGRAFRAGILADGAQRPISGIRISGCTFTEMYGACIALREVADVLVDKNRATTTNFELLHVTGARMSSNIRVTDNVCRQIGTGDLRVQSNGVVLSNVQDVIFARNSFASVERNALKLEQTCRRIVVNGNMLDENSSDNFAFVQVQSLGANHAEDITISGNRASNVGAGFAFNTARLSGVLVENNEIIGTKGPTMGDGVQLANGDMRDVIVRGNVLRGIRRQGVYLGQSTKESRIADVSITNNEISGDAQKHGSGSAILVAVFGGNEIPVVENIQITGNQTGPGLGEANGIGCIMLSRRGTGKAIISRLVISNNKFAPRRAIVQGVVISAEFVLQDSEISN